MVLLSVNFESDEAIYVQIKNQIIRQIATDDIHDGDNLPSVRELAETIGINMHTVNKAYTVLKQEGYLTLDRRRGAVVSLDYNKLRAVEELKEQLRMVLAAAVCRNVSEDEIHEAITEVMREYKI